MDEPSEETCKALIAAVLALLPQNNRVLLLDELSEEYKKRPLENPAFDQPKNKKRKSNPLASPTGPDTPEKKKR